MKLHPEKGGALYLSVIILALLLGVSLGAAGILAKQYGSLRGLGKSVAAFYASETGVDRIRAVDTAIEGCWLHVSELPFGMSAVECMENQTQLSFTGGPCDALNEPTESVIQDHVACLSWVAASPGFQSVLGLSNGAVAEIRVDSVGENGCPEDRLYCVLSKGMFEGSQRAIRLAR